MPRSAVPALVALSLLSACLPMMPPPGGGAPGTSPQVCANILARANATQNPAAKAYALQEAAKVGC